MVRGWSPTVADPRPSTLLQSTHMSDHLPPTHRGPHRTLPHVCGCHGCNRPPVARDGDGVAVCLGHYQRWRRAVSRNGSTYDRGPLGAWHAQPAVCRCPRCDRSATSYGLCATHYARFRRHGAGFDQGPIRHRTPPVTGH